MYRKIIKASHYLKLFALIVILSGFAVSAAVDPVRLVDFFGSGYGQASVGVSTTVLPNPSNTLAMQLKEKESKLEAQEDYLNVRDKELGKKMEAQKTAIIILSIAVFGLMLSVALNFYFDHKRRILDKNQWAREK